MSLEAKSKWLKAGNVLPDCVNINCNNTVRIRHWTSTGHPSIKSECSSCENERRGKNKKVRGYVQKVKKNYCENYDGHLGFSCAINADEYENLPSNCYELDHIDGNHFNNVSENTQTLCSICHSRKGLEEGDFNGNKDSSQKHSLSYGRLI
jgi:uncharacterized membrane protein|tara:strand:+ start:60 stop:512 length:453 start_codon:yes stop_codon:yes gene_type:complete